ncbi:MAG: PEP-CTERM sorting domain-containing protein [Phycisphaerales bacterium]
MKTLVLIGAAAVLAFAMPAGARIIVEDFANPAGTGPEFDPFFSYDFGGSRDFDEGDSHNMFIGSLLLSPDRVVIDFNELPGETVVAARIMSQELRAPGQTRITFRGENGIYTMLSQTQATLESFQLPLGQIGVVHSIEIIGAQTLIREIRVETERAVPAPAGTAALGVAGVGMLARRRRRA